MSFRSTQATSDICTQRAMNQDPSVCWTCCLKKITAALLLEAYVTYPEERILLIGQIAAAVTVGCARLTLMETEVEATRTPTSADPTPDIVAAHMLARDFCLLQMKISYGVYHTLAANMLAGDFHLLETDPSWKQWSLSYTSLHTRWQETFVLLQSNSTNFISFEQLSSPYTGTVNTAWLVGWRNVTVVMLWGESLNMLHDVSHVSYAVSTASFVGKKDWCVGLMQQMNA